MISSFCCTAPTSTHCPAVKTGVLTGRLHTALLSVVLPGCRCAALHYQLPVQCPGPWRCAHAAAAGAAYSWPHIATISGAHSSRAQGGKQHHTGESWQPASEPSAVRLAQPLFTTGAPIRTLWLAVKVACGSFPACPELCMAQSCAAGLTGLQRQG